VEAFAAAENFRPLANAASYLAGETVFRDSLRQMYMTLHLSRGLQLLLSLKGINLLKECIEHLRLKSTEKWIADQIAETDICAT
jgi:hypothetical protein